MTNPYEQLDERIKRFSELPWPDEMSFREWETARANRNSTALFYLIGSLEALTSPDRRTPNKSEIITAITDALDRAQPAPATV